MPKKQRVASYAAQTIPRSEKFDSSTIETILDILAPILQSDKKQNNRYQFKVYSPLRIEASITQQSQKSQNGTAERPGPRKHRIISQPSPKCQQENSIDFARVQQLIQNISFKHEIQKHSCSVPLSFDQIYRNSLGNQTNYIGRHCVVNGIISQQRNKNRPSFKEQYQLQTQTLQFTPERKPKMNLFAKINTDGPRKIERTTNFGQYMKLIMLRDVERLKGGNKITSQTQCNLAYTLKKLCGDNSSKMSITTKPFKLGYSPYL